MNKEECWGMRWGAEVDAARGNAVETVRVPSHGTKWSLLGLELEGSKNFTLQISTAVPANPLHKYPFDFLFILYYFISIPAMYVEGESSPRTFPEALI